MAGRYQGRHVFRAVDGSRFSIEVFWDQNGWFWRAHQPNGNVVGPFTTSSEAFRCAKAAHYREAHSPEGSSSLEASAPDPRKGQG